MKKITYCFMLLLGMAFSGYSQVQVGSGTVTGQHIPIEPYYGHTYSQSIYLASEINAAGSITSIQWYYAGPGESGLEFSQDITIYLGHTAKSEFASETDWEPITNLTEVYTGGIDVSSGPGWVTLELSTPFEYDGTSNLVVAAKESMEDYDEDEDEFSTFEVSGNRSLCYYNDDNNPDPSDPEEANYIGSYVPNIIFGGITQACPTPIALVVSDIGTSSATVTWDEPASVPSGGSDYYYSESNTPPGPVTEPSGNTLSGNSITIASGLNPATVYYVWVRNNCGSGVYSGWSAATHFITACVAVTEFNENFDSTPTEELPACWSSILRGPSLSEYAFVEVEAEQPYSAPNSAVLYDDESGSSDDIILVSPNLANLSAGTHRLKFYAKNDYDTSQIQIGTLDGNSETAAFTSYEDISTTTSATEYTIDFSGYSGTDAYIGIRMNANGNYNPIYIDNILWEVNPTCPDITELTVAAVDVNSATFTWVGNSETEWDVVVGASTDNDPSTLPFVVSNDPTKTISGLDENTSYKVWVRSVCAGNDNGAWIGPVTFKTDCAPIANFSETFDSVETPDLPACWSKILRGPSLSEYANVYTISDQAQSEPNAVELYNSDTNTNDNDIILVSPNLSTLAAGTHRLKFYARGYGSIQVGTLDSSLNTSIFSLVEEVAVTNTMTEYVVDFSSYTGSDKFIGLRFVAPDTYYSTYIDNILWEELPTCPDVTEVTAVSVATDGAAFTWVSNGTETTWDVAVGAASVTDPDTLTFVTSTEPAETISGLTPDTQYKVWVRSVCAGNDNGAWIGPVSFRTDCLPIADFFENFDSTELYTVPDCWRAITRGPSISEYAEIRVTDEAVHSDPNAILLLNDESLTTDNDIILASPNLSSLSAGTHRVKFWATGEGSVQVGTLDSNTDAATFNMLDEIALSDTPTQYTVDFTSYTGTDHYIGFRMNVPGNYYGFYLDDIRWEVAPTCPDVTDLFVSDATTTTATVSWVPGGSETAWEVGYADASVTEPAGITTTLPATDPALELAGLTDATEYNVWVRSVCAGNDYGVWIGPYTFATLCMPTSVPYSENFESASIPELPNCSSHVNAGTGPNEWITTDSPGYGFDSTTMVYNWNQTNAANAWFFTRGLNLTAGTDYIISYRYGNDSDDNYEENLKIMGGMDASPDGMTIDIADYPGIGDAQDHSDAITFQVPETGVYYFGFNAYSDADQDHLYVDDIMVDFALAVPGMEQNSFQYYPNPVKDVLNLSYSQNISTVAIYNILGQKVLDNTINANSAKVNMATLSGGSYIVKVTTADNQTKTIKVIKQ